MTIPNTCGESFDAKIVERLAVLSQQQDIRILYACESGSRAWGFASPDSDFDVRFIYARPVDKYLQLKPPRDVVEEPIANDLDISGWDIFKACRLLQRSNPPLLEWLGSPIVYLEDRHFISHFRREAQQHFSRRGCCEHYLSSARSNLQAYLRDEQSATAKRFLYVLRPLTAVRWMLLRDTFPPTAFSTALDETPVPGEVHAAIRALLEAKRVSRESARRPVEPILLQYVQESLESLSAEVSRIEPKSFPAEGLDGLVRSILLGAE